MLSSKQLIQLTLLFVSLCCISIFLVDQPLAYVIHEHAGSLQPLFRELTSFTDLVTGYTLWNYFSAALVMSAGIVFLAIDKKVGRAKYFFFVALTEVTSRLVVGSLKNVFERERPEHFLESGQPGQTFWMTGGDSFPSGHVGRYFGIFLPLMVLFPKYRLLLLIVPLSISLGRLFLSLHYLSDTLASIYVVIVIASLYSDLLKIGKRGAQPATLIHEAVH
jgi:membrane-associated phospholipid phosphatase